MNAQFLKGKVKQAFGQEKQERARRDKAPLKALEGKREEVVGAAQEKYGLVKEKAQEVMENLATRSDVAKKQADVQLDQYNRKMQEAAARLPGDVNQTITRYPWITVAAVLLLGLVIGMWLKPCFKTYEYKYKYYQN